MARFSGSLIFLFISVAVASSDRTSGRSRIAQLRNGHAGSSFISTLEFKHTLRVCNAYPFEQAIDVYVGKAKLTEKAMPYKKCQEFSHGSLKAGDKIDFKVGESSAGSFSISELPSNDAVLVLVLFRHDTVSTGVSFESHVFSNMLNAQVAVLDTYRGAAKASPRIMDVKKHNDPHHEPRSEELRYDSVMAINPGTYRVSLEDTDGKVQAKQDLVAVNKEAYMIMRCGVEVKGGKSYPMELMIYPMSDAAELGSAATTRMLTAFLATIFATAIALF